MTQRLSGGKWNPIVYDKGFVEMTELVNGKWKLVEYDTQEEAEKEEQRYREFWR